MGARLMALEGDNWIGKEAPELRGHARDSTNWINSEPLSLEKLRGKVVLVDFWEYSCINCVRTLPYLREWYKRYHRYGLEIIGIHVPEFEFGKDKGNVTQAVKRLGITWPVVLDNEYQTWNAYDNNVWPRELLIDQEGVVVHDQSGEGGYEETEKMIQKLLKKDNPGVKFPALMKLVRDTDNPHRVCYRTSPELYAGYARGKLGNPEQYKPDADVRYEEPLGKLDKDLVYLSGTWRNAAEYVRPVAPDDATWLGLTYQAKGVYAVIKPESESRFTVFVEQDGKPIPKEIAGDDIQFEDGRSFLVIEEPRMYRIIDNPKFGVHELKLYPTSDSFGFYTFTFESACEE